MTFRSIDISCMNPVFEKTDEKCVKHPDPRCQEQGQALEMQELPPPMKVTPRFLICDKKEVRKCENVILGSRLSPCQAGESVPQFGKVIFAIVSNSKIYKYIFFCVTFKNI